VRNYSKSVEWLKKAERVTPGASQTMSKGPRRYPVGAHPAFLSKGLGSIVWDLDGNRFIDWSCGLAAITLGYGHPEVDGAIAHQLMNGISFSLPHRLEAHVAERICSIFPCAKDGAVRFVKTGSEADAAAVRIARRYTGRDVVLCCGYLGWHDWTMVRAPEHPGVPDGLSEFAATFEYNDLFSLEQGLLLSEQIDPQKGAAAVIMEPALLEAPAPGFLQGVRDLCTKHGALLIFDEVVCGGRFALGGGQEYFGVTPDLCTWGKGLANGMPLAGVAGPREIMAGADVISGTFGGETLSLAACNATLDVYQREPVIAHGWEIGTAFKEGLAAMIEKYQLPARMVGYGVHPKLEWTFDHQHEARTGQTPTQAANLSMSLWLQEMAEGGVLVHPGGWNVSYSHTEQDVTDSLAAADRAFGICAEALADGKIRGRLRGAVITQGFKVR
jgi:glutamate-1-semialdehyde 2,1-aminomutase